MSETEGCDTAFDFVNDNEVKDQASTEETQIQTLSKNQQKKLRKKEKWEAMKQERRKREKQNRKRKLAERRENGEELGPTRKNLKKNMMKNSSCRIRVVVDMSLDEYMNDKDSGSLVDQLRYCYSDNRRAANPMQLYFCGSSGKTMKRLDEIGDVKGWDVHIDRRPYNEAFSKESLVYLSAESNNVLSTLSEDKVYVIGGLVDHNVHKGICHQLAEEKGIAHAQLPIQEYINLKTRRVLAVNHVFTILLRFSETNDWKESFMSAIPQRKQLEEKKAEASVQEQEEVRKTDEADSHKSEEQQSDNKQTDNTSPDNKNCEKTAEPGESSTDISKKDDQGQENISCPEVTPEVQETSSHS